MATVVHTVFRSRKQRERIVQRKAADALAEKAEAAEAAQSAAPSEESQRPAPPTAAATSDHGEASNRRHQRR